MAWGLAVLVDVRWKAGGFAAVLVGAGVVLVLARVFYSRMRGPTTLGPTGLQTDLTPTGSEIEVRGSAAPAQAPQSALDSARLLARWPTLEAALQSVPIGWTKNQTKGENGQDYIHLKSPQGGFEVVINLAACDSPAPRWLMVAISVMEND